MEDGKIFRGGPVCDAQKKSQNEGLVGIEQGLADYSPGSKPGAPPTFVNTVLLKHSCSFMDLCLSKSMAAFNGRVE